VPEADPDLAGPHATLTADPEPAEAPSSDTPAPSERPPRLRWFEVRAQLERFMPRPLATLAELVIIGAVALALAEGVQAAVVKPFKIPSGSMEPTLAIGQRVLVNRIVYRLHAPHRDDIIVFHPPTSLNCGVPVHPGQSCTRGNGQESSSTYFVKRVVGLPGESVAVRDGHPVINGHVLSNEPFINPCGGGPVCNLPTPIVVPKGDVFVMGDNRGDSDDSRFWGPVPDSWIIGQAFFTYWPPDRIGTP
jgi:signal peptidase I